MNRLAVKNELESILAKESIRSVFQPIVNCQAGTILGYEALSRGPQDSPLQSPAELFKAASEFHHLAALEVMCRQKSVQNFIYKSLPGLLFINVSPMALVDPEYPRGKTIQLLADYNIAPSNIVIEISEKYPMDNLDVLAKNLDYYRSLGFKTAIDDLGAGYSDLRLWSKLRPDFVKIDRHFIKNIDNDSVNREFVRGIIELSKGLGCEIIAEGIETVEELNVILDLGVNLCQGFFLARPDADPIIEISENSFIKTKMHQVLPKYIETAFSLCTFVTPVTPETPVAEVWELFNQKSLYSSLPVVSHGKPIGLIHRSKILETFSSEYGRALYSKRPVLEFVSKNAIIVEKNTTLDEISDLITNEDDMYVRQHFIVAHGTAYLGMGNTRDLLKKITDIKVKNARYANPLTLLPGNVPINEYLSECIKSQKPFHLAYFDINHFKPYNDIYGYQKGDKVIQTLGKLLSQHCDPGNNFIGHVGGDDFVVIFNEDCYKTKCEKVVAAFESSLRAFYDKQHFVDKKVRCKDRNGEIKNFDLVSLSVGVVDRLEQVNSADDYAQFAAEAKMKAKLKGRNQIFNITENVSDNHSPELLETV